jgi:predicted  nucleic acid-binding Zn-ribbon protein
VSELETLAELREADRFLDRLKSQRDHLPESADLIEVEGALRVLAQRLAEVEAERRPTRDAFQDAESRAESLHARRREVEERLTASIGPARELAALQTELERLTTALSEAEDQEVALLLELEPLEEVATSIRTEAQPLVERRAALQSAISELQSTLDDELTHRRQARAQTARLLPAALFSRYESAMTRAGVSGASRLDGERCDGCRVTIPPADLARVAALPDGDYFDCPYCGRLLLPC